MCNVKNVSCSQEAFIFNKNVKYNFLSKVFLNFLITFLFFEFCRTHFFEKSQTRLLLQKLFFLSFSFLTK